MIPTSALLGVIWFVADLLWDRGEQLYVLQVLWWES